MVHTTGSDNHLLSLKQQVNCEYFVNDFLRNLRRLVSIAFCSCKRLGKCQHKIMEKWVFIGDFISFLDDVIQ